MGTEARQLHVLFFPFVAPGHMIPMLDLAKLFASRGVRATIVTTHGNAPVVESAIARAVALGHCLEPLLLRFPSTDPELLRGREDLATISTNEEKTAFLASIRLLREPLERALLHLRPHAIVSDTFFPWTADVALEYGLPRLVFDGTNIFSLCASDALHRHAPNEKPPGDAESFLLPGLPDRVELLRTQLPDLSCLPQGFVEMLPEIREAEERSYGVVVNSFYDLEPEYAKYYREVVGRRTWQVGPVSLGNTDAMDKSTRGISSTTDRHQIMDWLDSKQPNSVIYICFGSLSFFTTTQMKEIALGLQLMNRPFIWVIRNSAESSSEWIPEDLEKEAMEGKGMIFRRWAPQLLILQHEAVGAFVTHCGWNSCLEGITAGVPMVTWPLFAEQFFNERFLVDVVGIGVGVGSKHFAVPPERGTLITGEEIRRAVDLVMDVGDEAEARKKRVKELGAMAKRAMEEGGSSYEDIGRLIEELEKGWK